MSGGRTVRVPPLSRAQDRTESQAESDFFILQTRPLQASKPSVLWPSLGFGKLLHAVDMKGSGHLPLRPFSGYTAP